VQRALLLRVWSDDVTLLADGPAEVDGEDAERLLAAGVTVDERRIAELRGSDSSLTAVAFADGGEHPCAGLLVPVTLHQRSTLAEQLGAAASCPGPVAVDAIEVDPMFHTRVPGLSAAGDVSSQQLPSVANAVAAGSSAAAIIVHGLMSEAHGLTAASHLERAAGRTR
jgi:thioredoxin reductase